MNEQVEQIAKRIKELREVLELSTQEVAVQLGIDVEEYLRYESGGDDIPVGVLYGAAALFQVDPTLLLTGQAPKMRSFSLVRQGDGLEVERYPGYRFSSLATNYIGREMEPMVVKIDPIDGEPEYFMHSGQEFNFVLDGKMKVLIGDHELLMEKGDSLYFDPRISHAQVAVDGPAVFLTVINEQATAYGAQTLDARRDREHDLRIL